MRKAFLEVKEQSIVLIGNFNPAIFHPQWLARKDLIGSADADKASITVNHPDISEFQLSFCNIQVLVDRFSITSSQETHFKSIRDLVINILKFLPETPVIQMGINLEHHYNFSDEKEYIQFGHIIVPKKPLWDSITDDPGVEKISIRFKQDEGYEGHKVITLNPSNKYKLGVRLQVNDHLDLLSS